IKLICYMRMAILILLLFSLVPSFGQIVKIQTGTSFSRMDQKTVYSQNTGFMGKERTDPLLFAGLEYCRRKYFSLSSNIGFLRIGGKEPWYVTDNSGNIISNTTASARFDYISL